MLLSDTTNKNGLIQECEFWTNLGDAAISGDSTLLKIFVNRLNRAYDRVVPLLLSYGDTMRWDDSTNHTKHPVATFDITSGVNDYQFLSDEQSNSILNIVDVHILQGSALTQYTKLRRMTLDEPDANRVMSPNTLDTGIPGAFLERNNTVFLDRLPTYSATAGGKIFFERSPSYLSASSLTVTPGIPEPAQPLLALEASLDYLTVHKPENGVLIAKLASEIEKAKKQLSFIISKKHPTRRRITGAKRCAI
jgi:hypothetical protein